MSFLSRISLANKSLVALVTIAILVVGAILIPSLKEELIPSITYPAISVVSVYPGASPSIVEQDVTDPLEQAIQGLSGVQNMTSTSSQNTSMITVSFNYGTDINQASQQISQRINSVQATLPTNVTPQVNTFSMSDLPVMQLAVTANEDQQTLATQLKQIVVPSLQSVNGVGNVSVTGAQTPVVNINLDLNKLKQYGLTVTQVQGALQADNITTSAGSVNADGKTEPIQVGNTFTSINDIKNIIVGSQSSATGLGGGSGLSASGYSALAGSETAAPPTPIKLSQVATVEETVTPQSSITLTNGKPSLGISIVKTTNGNTVSVSKGVNAKLSSLEQQLGHNASIVVISDQAPSISQSVNETVREGIIGAIFAIVVILIFLLSIRSTLVTAVSIPLSIVIALIGLYVGGYTLNLLTLGGLTIAIGRVVDDSIVILENIYRHLQQGEEKKVAIPRAVREVAGAVTASTLTTVSVFLPIAFTGGLVGELFSSFAMAVTIALLASLFVALTIVPVLAYWFMKSPQPGQVIKSEHENISFLDRWYVGLVSWVTGKRWQRLVTILGAIAILIVSVGLSRNLQTNFIGSSGQGTVSVSLTMPTSSSLTVTENAAKTVEQSIATVPGIQSYQTVIGSGGGALAALVGGGSSNSATITITPTTSTNLTTFQNAVQQKLNGLKNVGTLQISGNQSGLGGSSDLQVNVQNADTTSLRQATQQIQNAIAPISGLTDVSSNLANAAPEINITVNPQKATQYGLTPAQVAQDLRTVYSGTQATTITLDGTQQNVELYAGTQATTVSDIQNMLIPTGTGGTVALKNVATVQQIAGPTQITHTNTYRTSTVTGTITASNVGAVSRDVQQKIKALSLPAGTTVSYGGVTSDQSSAFNNLGIAVLIAILLVYCIMVATFGSLLQPIILLIAIPFAATGSLILLLITNTPLGVASLVGFLMLVGIVVTNAIVLLDLVRQYRRQGMDARTAVIEGGRHRLRPILMTAVATILALMPMALGIGGNSSGFISGPLAVVVIGGLTTSTILTLLIVPTLYVIVEGARGRAGGQGPDPVSVVDADRTEIGAGEVAQAL